MLGVDELFLEVLVLLVPLPLVRDLLHRLVVLLLLVVLFLVVLHLVDRLLVGQSLHRRLWLFRLL